MLIATRIESNRMLLIHLYVTCEHLRRSSVTMSLCVFASEVSP